MQRLETWVTDQRAPEGASLNPSTWPAVNEIAYLDQWNNEISRALTDLHSLRRGPTPGDVSNLQIVNYLSRPVERPL